uniref:Uncharacterized protein n=1 Tax=Anguilla anguilla TaxID=7936 RepID=A0A0E9SML7_ANGAN
MVTSRMLYFLSIHTFIIYSHLFLVRVTRGAGVYPSMQMPDTQQNTTPNTQQNTHCPTRNRTQRPTHSRTHTAQHTTEHRSWNCVQILY